MIKKLTKQERKDLAWKKYLEVKEPAFRKYKEECEKIDAEPEEIPEIIEQNGVKYKRIK